MSTSAEQSLFDSFPPISTDEWEQKIKQDLKGADYRKELRWHTGEGFAPLPFYRKEDLSDINRSGPIHQKYEAGNANDWEIRAPIFAGDIASANEMAQKSINRGAGALQFQLQVRRTEGALGGDMEGVPIQSQASFSELLENVDLEGIPVHFDAGLASPALLAMLWNEVQKQKLNPDNIRATFSYDPFVFLLQRGQYAKDKEQIKKDIADIAAFTDQHLPHVRPLGIDGRLYHHTGATIVQELGYGLAAASEYLAILTDSGIPISDAARTLNFNFSVASAYFPEIAKLRAARLLWSNLLEAYGAEPEANAAYLHAQTSTWNKTLYDPYTNMLRTSTESMSAAIAGCDAITVLPFNHHFRQPDDFSQRIARNQQLILSEESFMNKVADPSAGSYYIEQLTDQIGEKAWGIFQEVEKAGGLFQSIEDGFVQDAIQESQKQRDQAVADRERSFVGTSRYTNPDDTMVDEIDPTSPTHALRKSETEVESDSDSLPQYLAEAFDQGANITDVIAKLFDVKKQLYRTIVPYRGPEAFEELRLATEKSGRRPKVLNLPLGTPKIRKARSTFSNNFWGCAGYEIKDPIGFEDVSEAVEAIHEEQPDIAVLCSSDQEYEQLVPELCQQLGQMEQRPLLVLAGHPEERIESYSEAGIDLFIHSGCNVLEVLQEVQRELGIIEN